MNKKDTVYTTLSVEKETAKKLRVYCAERGVEIAATLTQIINKLVKIKNNKKEEA